MDTLTALDYFRDQRRFVVGNPAIGAALDFIAEALDRDMSEDGLLLARRIVRAIVDGSEELQPVAAAPIAHAAIFGTFRRAAHMVGLHLITRIDAGVFGEDSPILTGAASDALAILETADLLVAPASGLAAHLAVVLAGYSWRLA